LAASLSLHSWAILSICSNTALTTLLKHDTLPSTDAVGDWLRRTGAGAGLSGLDRINRHIVATRIRQTGTTAHPLDIDATQIKERKLDFGMQRMLCGQFAANAAFFRIGVIAHNLFVPFRHCAPDADGALAVVSCGGEGGSSCRCLGAEDHCRGDRSVHRHPGKSFALGAASS
jgi:hypothetical protein